MNSQETASAISSTHSSCLRWSRQGWLAFAPPPHEDPSRLVFDAELRNQLERLSRAFRDGRENFEALRLPWRRGLLFSGAAGQGKTAATRAIAHNLGPATPYITIPAHEISHAGLLERAFADALVHLAPATGPSVVILDHLDEMITRMEPHEFFNVLDHALERSRGTLWIATTRHAELLPKTQCVRPGRFDINVRFDGPPLPLREVLLRNLPLGLANDSSFHELLELTEGLTYAHFEELRQICATLLMEGREYEIADAVRGHLRDQLIAGNRQGGASDLTEALGRRIEEVDPRTLQAALNMTDVLGALMEKTLEAAFLKQQEQAGDA